MNSKQLYRPWFYIAQKLTPFQTQEVKILNLVLALRSVYYPHLLNFVSALLLGHITSDTVVFLGFAGIRTGGTPYDDLK